MIRYGISGYRKQPELHQCPPVYNFIMGDLPFRRVGELLEGHSSTKISLTSRIQALDSQVWRDIAGEIVASHSYVLMEGRDAIVYADSPIWAHSVSRQRLTLLDSMRCHGFVLETIRVRNQPPGPRRIKHQPHRKPIRIPTSASNALEQVASTVSNDGLRLALLRLSRLGSNAKD